MSYSVEILLKDLLKRKGITQKRLAQLTGLRENAISDIARGTKTAINFQHLGKIATALNVSDIREIMDLQKNNKNRAK